MKVYISKARELKEKYSNFDDWKAAMIREYGNDILFKIEEIWGMLLELQNKNIANNNDLTLAKMDEDKIRKSNIGGLKSYNIPLNPELLKLATEVIGLYAEKGIIQFDAVVKEAVKDFGDSFRPYIRKAWNEREQSKQEAINQNGNDKGIDQLPDKSNKESVNLIKEVNNMRENFIHNRWKAIYLIWFGIHLCLFLFSGNFFSNKYAAKHFIDQFYPFGAYEKSRYGDVFKGYFVIEVYDLTEFVFYLTLPILVYFIIKLWNSKENQ